MLKKLIFILVIVWICGLTQAQQLPIFSQYLYNKFLTNPAVAGSDGFTSYSLTAREQWIGYYGAPETFCFSGQTRLLKRSYILKQSRIKRQIYRPKSDGKVGFGGYIFSDKNGLTRRTGFQAAYSYHMWLQNSTQLSLGLAFTGYQFRINEDEVNFEIDDDPVLYGDLRKGVFIPDASFGVYILNPNFSGGFSVEQMFQSVLKLGGKAYDNYKMGRQINIFGSYNFLIDAFNEIQPSFMFRMSEQVRPSADIGATYIYKQSFWAGLAFRTSGALISNIGVKYQKLWFGYAFDFTLKELQRITYGTHEVTVAVRFGDSARRYRWLDRY